MNGSEFDHLLRQTSREPEFPLPPGFSATIVQRARQVRDFSRANRRMLTVASAAALGLAVTVAWAASPPSNDRSVPPSLSLFHPGSPASPFLTK
ncbi:MAG: hypothetical protein KDN19_16525 [Verrucomicrobiae bacterium]|nr:hypothetical protein [Verrucomicrobiae bacterium]